jgi:colanic acid biosynthesis glycosyl transferase WcaI
VRILFLTHYYAPELGAPQTRLRETAGGLRELGHTVRVLTGPPHYPDGVVQPGYRPWRAAVEQIDGVRVRRLPMWPRRNGGFLDRTIDQGSFAAVALTAIGEAAWADVVLVESPPLFLGATAAWYRALARRPYVFHVADPWPDFPIAMGALENPVARRVALALESLAYRHASFVTTVTPGLVELLDRKPAAHGKVRLVPNGVDTCRFDPARRIEEARASLGWPEARLHLVYAGSVGLAQGLGTLLDAAEPLRDSGIVVHIVGEGFERASLQRAGAARGLTHVHFEAALPPDRIPDLLAAADGVLVMLREGPLYEHALPTKLLEGLAAGRPIIASAGGEAARIVAESGAGIVAPPEDAAGLRRGIEELAGADRTAMGRAGRTVAERFDRVAVVKRLASVLVEAASARGGGTTPRSVGEG